jgi:CRISPR-associated protein Cas2
MRYVISYDIEEDRKRTRLSNLLLDYGDRVQKSVFEAELTAEALEELLQKATGELGEEDNLRIYPICGACEERIQNFGRPGGLLEEGLRIV